MKLENDALAQIVTRILQSPKYRGKGIQPDTVRDLILKDAPNYNSSKELTKSVRRKLHNIVASYLGESDYKALTEKWLNIKEPSPDSLLTRTLCLDILSQHASTKERIPTLEFFYTKSLKSQAHPIAFSTGMRSSPTDSSSCTCRFQPGIMLMTSFNPDKLHQPVF